MRRSYSKQATWECLTFDVTCGHATWDVSILTSIHRDYDTCVRVILYDKTLLKNK